MTVDPSRVLTTAAWRRLHDPHRTPGCDHDREDAGHPSGEWVRLRCNCGVGHTTTKDEADRGDAT